MSNHQYDKYRVWPDGTVQSAESDPHQWMSDDYIVLLAESEDHAYLEARKLGYVD